MERLEPPSPARPAPWVGRSRAAGIAVALLWLAGPPTAHAQEAATPRDSRQEGVDEARVRVAVLLVQAGDVEPETADGLTELLIGSVAARGGVTIVGKEEFQAQLGQGDDGTLDCISSTPCIGRVGVQLAVREVIAGTLSRRDGIWIFNLNRMDVRSGEVTARVFREVHGELTEVADALDRAIHELYEPPREPAAAVSPASLVVVAQRGAEVLLDGALLGTLGEAPLETRGLSPGQHEVRVSAPGFAPWSRTIHAIAGETTRLEVVLTRRYEETVNPWFLVSAAIAVASAGTAVGLGVHSQRSLDLTEERRQDGTVTRAEALAFYGAREVEATAANVLFGVSAAAAALAVTLLFFPERSPLAEGQAAASMELRVAPTRVSVEGRF